MLKIKCCLYLCMQKVAQVLDFIFNNPCQTYPSIESLALTEFFRNIDLREMRCSTVNNKEKLKQKIIKMKH